MHHNHNANNHAFKPVEDPALLSALNELGRSINIITTYGKSHPAVAKAVDKTIVAMNELFLERKKILIGSFNGSLTVDEVPVQSVGVLMKSLERRLSRLQITGLRITQGISDAELTQLAELLACNEIEDYQEGMSAASLSHIVPEDTHFKAVRNGQTVANESDLSGMAGDGVLVLDDDSFGGDTGGDSGSVHVDQIVAFLKGDLEADADGVGEELAELASDPARLGKMIMESVAIRQSVSQLSGESLNDIILGCLRRTYDGLRKQPAFQSSQGMADMQKALLLLEESLLDKMRGLTGEDDPELDRQIVQAIREMDEKIGFEIAAAEYMEHREAIEENKQQLQSFIEAHGADSAGDLISESDFPSSEWRKIVIESGKRGGEGGPPMAAGLNSLANVFEKLETLMKGEGHSGSAVKDLLDEATDNLDDTINSTKEKLDSLSKQLDTGTIGGQAQEMTRKELLSSISEVAQELKQPLTAINASLEMMLMGFVGNFSPDQLDLLNLAANSGEHLKFLMDELINIVGLPTNKGVDPRFHTTSDQVVLMKKN